MRTTVDTKRTGAAFAVAAMALVLFPCAAGAGEKTATDDTPKPPPSDAERLQRLEEALEEQKRETAALKRELSELRAARDERAKSGEPEPPAQGISGPFGIEIFAFGDFQIQYRESGKNGFAIGQLEVDFLQSFSRSLDISAAVAYDGASSSFGIGAFGLHGHLVGKGDNYLIPTDAIDALTLTLGQFDVPFGIAYEEYPSISRRLVTSPIAIDATHDSWNDLGGQLYLEMGSFDLAAYCVNGFGYSHTDSAGTEVTHEMAFAFGGRAGVRPSELLSFGASFAGFVTPGRRLDSLMAGGDAALSKGGAFARGEYIYKRDGIADELGIVTQGTYATVGYDFDPVFVSARHSAVRAAGSPFEQRLTLGAGIAVMENAEIRVEYTTSLRTGGSEAYLQFAGGTFFRPRLHGEQASDQ